jgi:integrase
MALKRERVAKFPGVYSRTGLNRPMHRGKPDTCFDISYKDQNGKKIWEKIGWSSEGITAAYANQIRAERMRSLRLGQEVIPLQQKRKDNAIFSAIANEYLTWAENNKKSSQDDASRYRTHIKAALGDKRLVDITPLDLESLKNTLFKKDLAPATVKHCLVLVRQIFNKAIEWGKFNGPNPIKRIKLPKIENKRTRFLSSEEAISLLEALKKVSINTHDIACVSLLTGMRYLEISSLQWGDVDSRNNIIHIRKSKHGEARQVYMINEVAAIFEGRKKMESNPSDLVFPNLKGELQTKISHTFMRTVKALKLNEGIENTAEKIVFHSLRHTFASWLATKGTPLYTIKELMGHKTIEMTERYAHLIPDTKREAINQVSDIFKGASGTFAVTKELSQEATTEDPN